jgi:hypothetical protein
VSVFDDVVDWLDIALFALSVLAGGVIGYWCGRVDRSKARRSSSPVVLFDSTRYDE